MTPDTEAHVAELVDRIPEGAIRADIGEQVSPEDVIAAAQEVTAEDAIDAALRVVMGQVRS